MDMFQLPQGCKTTTSTFYLYFPEYLLLLTAKSPGVPGTHCVLELLLLVITNQEDQENSKISNMRKGGLPVTFIWHFYY